MAMYENISHGGGTGANAGDPKDWLHGNLSRDEVKDVMAQNGMTNGLFLVRESTRNAGDFVLSVAFDGKPQHYIIKAAGGTYNIDDGPAFTSLPALVEYYMVTADRLPMCLTYPCPPMALYEDEPGEGDAAYEEVWHGDKQYGDVPPNVSGAAALANYGDGSPNQQPGYSAFSAARGGIASQQSFDQPIYQNEGAAAMGGAPAPSAYNNTPAPSAYNNTPAPSAYNSTPRAAAAAAAAPAPRATAPVSIAPVRSGNTIPKGASMPAGAATLTKGGMKAVAARDTAAANNPDVKRWLDGQDAVDAVTLKVNEENTSRNLPEGFTADSSQTAKERQEAFNKAAVAEEKMNIHWLNMKLKPMGESVEDIGPSLQDGVIIMKVLASFAHLPPPKYKAKPIVPAQKRDNWNVVVTYMRKLGVQVDDDGTESDLGLNADALFNIDRRELLKLFSKLMVYENKLGRRK